MAGSSKVARRTRCVAAQTKLLREVTKLNAKIDAHNALVQKLMPLGEFDDWQQGRAMLNRVRA